MTDPSAHIAPSLAVGGEYVTQRSAGELPALVRVTVIEGDKALGRFFDAVVGEWDHEDYPVDPSEVVAPGHEFEALTERFVRREMARDDFIVASRRVFTVVRTTEGLLLYGPAGAPITSVSTEGLADDARVEVEAAFAEAARAHTAAWVEARLAEWDVQQSSGKRGES